MIKKLTRPSSARCTLPVYISYLLSEPGSASCCGLAQVMNISHDSINRFLQRETYAPAELFDEGKALIVLEGGVLSVDDTVLDKPYANYMAYVDYFWSGKHHASVKGINLISLYYTDINGRCIPVNFRIYDKAEGKTKNDYFLEMLAEVLAWGLKPVWVTGDSWYSPVKNLKTIKKHGLGFLFGLKGNRTVSIKKGDWQQVQSLNIPAEGLIVWLKDFGYIKLFRTYLKDQARYHAVYQPSAGDSDNGLLMGASTGEPLKPCTHNTGKLSSIIGSSSRYAT